jgi:hypothetical protein
MKFARSIDSHRAAWATLVTFALAMAPRTGAAADSKGVVFKRPQIGGSAPASTSGVQFRSYTPAPAAPAATPTVKKSATATAAKPTRIDASAPAPPAPTFAVAQATHAEALPLEEAPLPVAPKAKPRAAVRTAALPSFAQPGDDLSGTGVARRSRAIQAASIGPLMEEPGASVEQAGFCDTCCEPECGILEPGCGTVVDPGCGCIEPECGLAEAGCGIAEPDCGMVGCGSCVGNPGPDYWCFPVCLPRFKDLRFWGGVHGFKGPRDSPLFGGAGDGNFGFQEGVNIGGRAPLVSLLFPQLSYQLGYQAVQSQLSGLSDGTTEDRSQQFVTGGVFRRVRAGLQFGVVWDMLRDDFQMEEDFHQLRYEVSFKSPVGHEFGFWGASHMNDKTVAGINYESVDQYTGFYRFNFRDAGSMRAWVGATNDNEVVVGADIVAPLSTRWSVQTGFNYLITDEPNGEIGAREESWNVGMNLVWHYGFMAKKTNINPHAPLFQTADNGWLMIDQAP